MTTAQEKIKLAVESCNKEDFRFVDCQFGGDDCVLVCPVGFPKWTQVTKFLRSVVYRKSDYYPVSLGFPKFTNLGENPENFPVPTSLDDCSVVEKKDGSLLIFSKYKDELIIRTRGSTGIENCLNKDEINIFRKQYPYLFDFLYKSSGTWAYSLLHEWCSNSNKIVLDYGPTPKLFLIGAVFHESYDLFSQAGIKNLGLALGLETPEIYEFKSVYDLINNVKSWKNKEGVVLYRDQEAFKVKSDDYLVKHRFKNNLDFESILDLFFQLGKPSNIEFLLANIESTYDYECAKSSESFCVRTCSNYNWVLKEIERLTSFCNELKDKELPRAKVAKAIQEQARFDLEKSLLFQLYDGKPIADSLIRKLIKYYDDEIPF